MFSSYGTGLARPRMKLLSLGALLLGLGLPASSSSEETLPDPARIVKGLQVPLGNVEDLIFTRVGWEDLLDRYPSTSIHDLPRLRHEIRMHGSPTDYQRLVRLLLRVSRKSTAIKTAEAALRTCFRQYETEPANSTLATELGLALVNLRLYPEALAQMAKALEAGQKRANTYAAYAMACLSVGQIDAAQATMEKAMKKFKYRPEVLLALHYTNLNQRNTDPAALRKAVVEPDPTKLEELLDLKSLREAIELDPDYLAVRRTLGATIIDILRERARRQRGLLGTLHSLRVLEQDEELLKEAIKHLDYVIERDTLASASTLWMRAVAAILAGKPDEAASQAYIAEGVHFRFPKDSDVLFVTEYAAWLMEQNADDQIRQFLQREEVMVPEMEGLLTRAACFWKLGDLKKAEHYSRLFQTSLTRPLGADERRLRAAGHAIGGAIALSKGKYAEATDQYRQSIRWSPRYVWADYGLAASLFLNGKATDSLAEVQKVAGLLSEKCPAKALLAAFHGIEKADEFAATNRNEVKSPEFTGVPKLLDENLDWLITMLSFWRAQGPLPVSENVITNPGLAKAAVTALLKHWESEQFPEPRLELLATARLVTGMLPLIEFNDEQAASLRKISEEAFSHWKYQEAHRSPAGLGDASDFPDPFDSPLPLAQMANKSVLGCNTDAEKIHALSTWLSFRPKLEYGPARSILACLEQHIAEPRTRLTPDESAAILIAAARFIGLKAHYIQLPSIEGLDGFAPACAAIETKQGLILSSPGLGIFGQTYPSATLPAEEEVRALYHGLWPGHDRLERLRQAVREFPGSGRAQLALAELLVNRPGQIEAALKYAGNASRLLPLYPEAHAFHGAALELSGDIENAHAAFRRASRLRPDSELPFIARGLVLARQTKFAASVIEFRSALALSPYHLDARSYLAASLSQADKKKEALEEARMVFRQDDSRSELHMLILDLLFDLDDEDAVIIELEELLAAQPENRKARDFLKLIYKKQGREEEAKSLEIKVEDD